VIGDAPVLVLGARGQVARELARLGLELGMSLETAGRERLDLSSDSADETVLGALIDQTGARGVINAAAYTAVDLAESEPERAFHLNRDIPGRLARVCADRAIPLVHYSTDYGFDGAKAAAYVETDPRSPLNVYGRSKAGGEDQVLAAGGDAIILRTAWVFGAFGRNFMKTMLSLAETRTELTVVDDQRGRPTWSRDAAQAGLAALDLLRRGGPSGLYHAAGADDASWADLAEHLMGLRAVPGRPSPAVRRITTAEFPTAAQRSPYSGLDSSRLAAQTDWRPSGWRSAASAAYADLQSLVSKGIV
jgi:dTDP-4-dehydrorhamnose reductase